MIDQLPMSMLLFFLVDPQIDSPKLSQASRVCKA